MHLTHLRPVAGAVQLAAAALAAALATARQPSRALTCCNPFSKPCSPLLQIIAKRKRLNDPTAKLEQDEVEECDSAWSATRARRGALSCKMDVLYVLPIVDMGHRHELLGWTKVLVTEHEHFVEEIVVDEAEQNKGYYLGYAMFEEFANVASSQGWSKRPVRLQLADVGAEAAASMYKRLAFQQWKRPTGDHVIRGGRRCRVPWTADDDPKAGCKMLQASFNDVAMNAKLAADRGREGRASRKIKFIVCLGLGSNQPVMLEDDEDEDEGDQEVTSAARADARACTDDADATEHAADAAYATGDAADATGDAADATGDAADDAGAPTNAQDAARHPNSQRAKPSHPPRRRNNKRHLELQDVFDDLGLADSWERFQYVLDGGTCAGLRPVHKDTAEPKPAHFKSAVGRVRLTWPRLQVSRAYAARVDHEKNEALNSILIDVLDRRLVPASDVDALVTKLCAHIKDLKREIASLALLQDGAEEEEGDEGILPLLPCNPSFS